MVRVVGVVKVVRVLKKLRCHIGDGWTYIKVKVGHYSAFGQNSQLQMYLTLIGSFWTPGEEGGGLFFRYFSLSKETIWQFFSSLLSSQSWNGRELLERTEQIQ